MSGTNTVHADHSDGVSPKLKAVALITGLFSSTVTLVAVIKPDLLDPLAWAAVGVWGNTVGALVGAYWGGPGDVVVAQFPFDPTPELEHDPKEVNP